MSTNKTQNYSLHAWEPGDDFLRAEINENFAAVDAVLQSKAEYVFGTYTGDGATKRHIELGRMPGAVYIWNKRGESSSSNGVRFGLFGPGAPISTDFASVDDTGFTLSTAYSSSCINDNKSVYHFVAFF